MSIDRDIAVSYLLGELGTEDRESFEAEMVSNPDLREYVEELRPVVGKLEAVPAEVWQTVEPPPLDLARATAAAQEAPLEVREAEFEASRRPEAPGRSPWMRFAGFFAAGAALLLVGFLIGSGTGGDDSPTTDPGPALALDRLGEAPASASGQVRMVSSEGDQMRLEVAGLEPSTDGEFYEAWLLGKDGDLIALGSFRVGEDGDRSVELPLPVDPASFEYFDVSIEANGEGPDHSGRSVLRGLTTY